MSHLVREIEDMVTSYLAAKYDDDALRVLTGYDLNTAMENDEDATYDLSQRLLYLVLQQVDWNKIVAKAQENLADDDEETNPDDE
jgi:uncharacterized protein with PhoU and TrkA domain